MDKTLDKLFKYMKWGDDLKVMTSPFILRDEADYWYDINKDC